MNNIDSKIKELDVFILYSRCESCPKGKIHYSDPDRNSLQFMKLNISTDNGFIIRKRRPRNVKRICRRKILPANDFCRCFFKTACSIIDRLKIVGPICTIWSACLFVSLSTSLFKKSSSRNGFKKNPSTW